MAPRNPRPAPPAAELTDLHHARGLTLKQICTVYGEGIGVVRRWFDEQNVPRLQSGKRPAELATPERRRPSRAEMEELYAQGLSQKEIAEKTGFSKSSVNQWFREAGIATRPIGGAIKVRPTDAEYEFIGPDHDELDTHTPDPTPFPPPRTGKARLGRPPKRPWLRLSDMERRIVARRVDEFLVYAQVRKAA
jgi:transposase